MSGTISKRTEIDLEQSILKSIEHALQRDSSVLENMSHLPVVDVDKQLTNEDFTIWLDFMLRHNDANHVLRYLKMLVLRGVEFHSEHAKEISEITRKLALTVDNFYARCKQEGCTAQVTTNFGFTTEPSKCTYNESVGICKMIANLLHLRIPPNVEEVIGQIDQDAQKFAAKFKLELLKNWSPGNNISEADILKMLSKLNWSNEREVSTFLVKLFNYLHKRHKANINSVENSINNTISSILHRSILNYNKLLENLMKMHENRSTANTEFPKMTEGVAVAARMFETNLETMMSNITKQSSELKKMMLASIGRTDFLKEFIAVSKQNKETMENSLKTFFNELEILESNAWNKESISENYKNEIERLKAKKYSVSDGCAFGEGFLAGLTLGIVVIQSCEETAAKKEKERLNEIADLTNKEKTVEVARKVIDKRLSKLNKTLYDSYCIVEILNLIDPEIQKTINESSIKLGNTSIAIEEIDKIVDKLEEMKTEGRLVLDSMDLKDCYLLDWEELVDSLGNFAVKAHFIFQMKQNPFRVAIGGDEWFDLQSSILNILKKDYHKEVG